MKEITLLVDFEKSLKGSEKVYLLVYKKGTGVSDCAYTAINSASINVKGVDVYYVNAPENPEIHQHYGITSAPSLLVFEKGTLKDVVKGCLDESFYKQLFENAYHSANQQSKGSQKSVTVYSTPTCSWCNTLKGFLRKNGILFTDIDVSRNQEAARQMVSATGQQGVPQTNIGGEWVVGFDQQRIKRLLNIQSQ